MLCLLGQHFFRGSHPSALKFKLVLTDNVARQVLLQPVLQLVIMAFWLCLALPDRKRFNEFHLS
jgi:hypothetical protein